ncbi:MAG TPA: hypothetical protein V6C58_24085, partial [Allocoleopsis sp.]
KKMIKANRIFFDKAKRKVLSQNDKSNNNIIAFDSKLEFLVYRELEIFCKSIPNLLPEPLEYQITTQEKVTLFDSFTNEPYQWKCDFKVSIPAMSYLFYVEAKGVLTEVFRLKMQLLKANNYKVWERLIVVCYDSANLNTLKKYCHVVLHLKDFKDNKNLLLDLAKKGLFYNV